MGILAGRLGSSPSVLVTGCSGVLGAGVVETLRGQGHAVVAATRSPSSPRAQHLREIGVCVVRADTTDPESVAALPRASVLVHLAEARDETLGRERLWDINVGAVCRMLDWARRNGVERVVLRGATEATGWVDLEELPVDESHPCRPDGVYGHSKLTAERAALQWSAKHTIPIAVARLAPVFGGGARWAPLERALRYVLTGVLGAQPSDDYLHPVAVADAVAALVLLARDRRPVSRPYFVSGPSPFTERELFRRLAEYAGRRSLAERLAARPPDPGEKRHQGYLSAQLERDLGWRARGGLDQDLVRTVTEATRDREALSHAAPRQGLVSRVLSLVGA